MSNIYGNQIIPNDISSLYFFDKTYDNDELSKKSSRKLHAEEDGVLIGRYVLNRTVDTSGNSLTINKVFRKVATSEGVDYEQVAVLDAVTPTFRTATVNINKELFNIKNNTFTNYIPTSTNNTISISAAGTRDYTKAGAPIEHDVKINLPVLGETVAAMNNLMYGQTNRLQVVNNVDELTGKIDANGRTLKADGIIGVLGNLNWTALKNANKVDWALKYLKITEDLGDAKISDDYLSLDGGTMKNKAKINWAGTNAFLTGKDTGDVSSLYLGAGNQSIRLNSKNGISMTDTMATNLEVQNPPISTHDVVRYEEVKRLVSQGGMPYILSSGDITKNTAGDIKIYASNYSSLPANTIFFVKAGN